MYKREEESIDEKKYKALWHTHCFKRCSQHNFTFAQVYEAWNRSVEQELSLKQQEYKFRIYGMRSLQSRYFWDEEGKILFTIHETKAGQWYVVTVTKGRGNGFSQVNY